MAEVKNREMVDRHPYSMFPGRASTLQNIGYRWDYGGEEQEYIGLIYFIEGSVYDQLWHVPTRRITNGPEEIRDLYDEIRERHANTNLPGLEETLCKPEEITVLVLVRNLTPVLISGN